MLETASWLQYLGLAVFLTLCVWIPIAVWRTRGIWNQPWKGWSWFALHLFIGTNIVLFLVYLLRIVWKRTAACHSRALKWLWRSLACVPGINPAAIPLFLRLERAALQDKGGADLTPLRGVTTLYSAVVVTGLILAVVGRPPAVRVAADQLEHPGFEQYLAEERKFLTGDANTRPNLCVSLSGGGIRSAAFSLGVLQSLHETGILPDVEIISAVSGGTYALSWLVLQPYYAAALAGDAAKASLDTTLSSMFLDDGPFQRYLQEKSSFVESEVAGINALFDMTFGQLFRWIAILGRDSEMLANGTGARKGYAAQIQNAFHSHPRKGAGDLFEAANALRLPKHIEGLPSSLWIVQDVEFSNRGRAATDTLQATGIKGSADGLAEFFAAPGTPGAARLPYPVFNTKLNVDAAAAHYGKVWPGHFETTPLGLGGPAVGYSGWEKLTGERYQTVRSVNIAPAISGAAVSGYAQATPRPLRPLLRLLNADLGYYVPNVFSPSPRVMYLSDGGHSENLGLYALIRRECRQIVAVDAEYEAKATGEGDSQYKFESYGDLVKAIEKEGVARILLKHDFDVGAFRAAEPVFEGDLEYSRSGRKGSLVYIKLALDRAQIAQMPPAVQRYVTPQRAKFPHDSTMHQSYAPEQFHAYQKLGHHIACQSTAVRALAKKPCAG